MQKSVEPTSVCWLTLCFKVCIVHMSSSDWSVCGTPECENSRWSPMLELLRVQSSVGDQRWLGVQRVSTWSMFPENPGKMLDVLLIEHPTNESTNVGWHLTAVTPTTNTTTTTTTRKRTPPVHHYSMSSTICFFPYFMHYQSKYQCTS